MSAGGYGSPDPYGAPVGPKGPLDGMFANTNIVILVLFALCCGLIAFVLGLVGMLTAKDPKAKSNATLVVIISGVLMAIGILINVLGVGVGLMGGAAGR